MSSFTHGSPHPPRRCLLIFNPAAVDALSSDDPTVGRLPPSTSLGVLPAAGCLENIQTGRTITSKSDVTYKIIDEGVERRMTSAEKKLAKIKRNQAKKDERKKQKMKAKQEVGGGRNEAEEILPFNYLAMCPSRSSKATYHVLPVKKSVTQDEFDDEKNFGSDTTASSSFINSRKILKRKGSMIPAVLSAPMMRYVQESGLLKEIEGRFVKEGKLCSHTTSLEEFRQCPEKSIVDDHLAERWAAAIKRGMYNAEKLRASEDLRPMAYQIVPEVWSRLRPQIIVSSHDSGTTTTDKIDKHPSPQIPFHTEQNSEENLDCYLHNSFEVSPVDNPLIQPSFVNSAQWSILSTIRRSIDQDVSLRAVFETLRTIHPSLHIGCGAKFGSDYLLYDGPREDRHAFAGLRVMHFPSLQRGKKELKKNNDIRKLYSPPVLPIPCPYEMAGFVRGLNTAGKLALVATVIPEFEMVNVENGDYRCKKGRFKVAFVDLALEKILNTHTHKRKRGQQERRKDISGNLAKN